MTQCRTTHPRGAANSRESICPSVRDSNRTKIYKKLKMVYIVYLTCTFFCTKLDISMAIRPAQSGIASKQLNISSKFFHLRVASSL